MIKNSIKNFFCFALMLLLPHAVFATDCQDNIQKIFTEFEKTNSDRSLIKLSFLLKTLGEAQQKDMMGYDIFAEWPSFLIWQSNTGEMSVFGSYPGLNDPKQMSFQSAKQALGKPVAEEIDYKKKYQWQCNDGSSLNVIAYDSGELISINGNACDKKSCKSFSKSFNTLNLAKNKFETQMKVLAPTINKNVFDNKVKPYNTYFHTQIKNDQQLQTDMLMRLKKYFANLRSCRPGKYYYPHVSPSAVIIQQANIKIMHNDFCLLQLKEVKAGKRLVCQIPKEDLQLFTEIAANKALESPLFNNINEIIKKDCE